MIFEQLIAALNSRGWLLGSICQVALSDWYACLIDEEGFAHTATGTTHIKAIENAFVRPATKRLYSYVEGVYTDEDETQIDLVALGLKKQREPLKRRF